MTAQTDKKRGKGDKAFFDKSGDSKKMSLSVITKGFFSDFFSWWYVQMPVKHILTLRRIITVIDDKFSISILFKTFFTPWHRDKSFVGYLVGFSMRALYLPIALSVLFFFIGGYLAFLIFWTILPPTAAIMSVITPFL